MKNSFNSLRKKLMFSSLLLTCFVSLFGCANTFEKNVPIIKYIQKQLSFGPRIPGSDASLKTTIYF